MSQEQLEYKIRIRKLDILVNKLMSSNWGVLLLAIAFAFFYWETASPVLLVLFLGAHVLITTGRALFVYPQYYKTEITRDNVDAWLNWFTFTLGLTTSVWAIALPFFFVPDNTNLLLVLMFAFFTLMVSGSVALASHLPGFYAFSIPLIVVVPTLFVLGGDKLHMALGGAFLLFGLFNVNFCWNLNKDITELITLELEKEELAEELEKKNVIAETNRAIAEKSVDEKNRFLAAASHDMRQPLHSSGLLLSAMEKHVSSDEGKEILSEISSANKALTNSFTSLLDLSKLDAGVVETHLRHLSVQGVMYDIEREFIALAKDKDLQLNFSGPDVAVYSDESLLTRILRNLISNAINYTESGAVDVRWQSTRGGRSVELIVLDTGSGIQEHDTDNIFSEYYQVGGPERDRRKGFGLGLAIVKRLCDLLDITLRLESAVGVGSAFRLTVSSGDMASAVKNYEAQKEWIDLSNITILVIDDDISALNSMRKLLESWGCQALCADSEEQAITKMSQADIKPDLILADYLLREDRTGVQACKRVFDELNATLPAAIITGDTSPGRLQSVAESGFRVLHKPLDANELRSFIQKQVQTSYS